MPRVVLPEAELNSIQGGFIGAGVDAFFDKTLKGIQDEGFHFIHVVQRDSLEARRKIQLAQFTPEPLSSKIFSKARINEGLAQRGTRHAEKDVLQNMKCQVLLSLCGLL